jgi:hypothetical protein
VTVTVDRRQAQETGDETVEQGEDAESEDAEGEDAGAPQPRPVSQEEAEQIAVDAAGGGRATSEEDASPGADARTTAAPPGRSRSRGRTAAKSTCSSPPTAAS